jgi:hypothetical protein
MQTLTHTQQLELAAIMSVVAILLTGRMIKEQREWPRPPATAFRLVWDFIIGVWMLAIATWLALVHDYVLFNAGKIIGLCGCIYMVWGAFKMNRKVATAPPPSNKELRISEIKKAKKK